MFQFNHTPIHSVSLNAFLFFKFKTVKLQNALHLKHHLMVQTLAEHQLEAGVIFFTSGDANPATLAI